MQLLSVRRMSGQVSHMTRNYLPSIALLLPASLEPQYRNHHKGIRQTFKSPSQHRPLKIAELSWT